MYEPYYVIITLFLGSAISFSSLRKCIYCNHVVSVPSFLLLLFLPPSLTPSLSHPSLSTPSISLHHSLRSSIPGLVYSQFMCICHMLNLKVAKVPKYNLAITIYQIVKFTFFARYCIFYTKSHVLFRSLKC